MKGKIETHEILLNQFHKFFLFFRNQNLATVTNWKAKEKTVKSLDSNGEIQIISYEPKKIKFPIQAVAIITIVTPFLLLYIQRCNDIRNTSQEKLADTYVKFSKDVYSIAQTFPDDSSYNIALSNIKFSYAANFNLYGTKEIIHYYDSIKQLILIRDALFTLRSLTDKTFKIIGTYYNYEKFGNSVLFNMHKTDSIQLFQLGKLKLDTLKSGGIRFFIIHFDFPKLTSDTNLFVQGKVLQDYFLKAASIINQIKFWKKSDVSLSIYPKAFDYPDSILFKQSTNHQYDFFIASLVESEDSISSKNASLSNLPHDFGALPSFQNDEKIYYSYKLAMHYILSAQNFQMPYLRSKINRLQSGLDSLIVQTVKK
jgi:hypothetical protein